MPNHKPRRTEEGKMAGGHPGSAKSVVDAQQFTPNRRPGLDPGIHVFLAESQDIDGRVKSGLDTAGWRVVL
jgi:hypothetical protein